MGRTIRWRLTIPYALLVIAAMLGLSLYLVSALRTSYLDRLKSNLAGEARVIAEAARPLIVSPPDRTALEALAHRYADLLRRRVTLIATDGTVLGESETDPALMENHLGRPEVQAALKGQEFGDLRLSATLHEKMMYLAVPIQSNGRILGVARVAVSVASIEAEIARFRQTIYLAALVTIALAILTTTLLTGYALRPLGELTRAAQRMASGDLQPTLLPTSRDEIGQLNLAFNQMADHLREKIDALRSEQDKLSAVLARMTDGVIIVDAQGEVELINPAAARLFRVNQASAIGKTLIEVVRQHQLAELWQRCVQTGEQQSTTLELSSERLFLQGIATSLKQSLPGSILLLVQDLTRLRRLETVRQDFISNVSHELRTPLASLKALTETLQEGALEDPPAARRFLTRMDTEVDTLTQMVRELLELSRIESGRVPLKLESVSVQDLLNPAVERMRLQAERAGLRLSLECPADLPAVQADSERIGQVLVNLLHNAVKFTPPGGEIHVVASAEPGRVVIQVRDSGVGIAEKDLARIFERFYKADRARSGGGTGLGLSIARHLVEAHGGKIWAESTPGSGSIFSFDLPVAA
ncbi:MAG: ATP-binding protein [Anaerolineaceae bacterium]|nr:ATP-binding protein [Anaerolineaceae bacterium]